MDGTKFDSSVDRNQPFSFRSAAAGHQGLDEGVVGMKVGGKRTLIILPAMGYGARARAT
jgi:FKBP-type peptidyl-prolyl cis-trans isomerase